MNLGEIWWERGGNLVVLDLGRHRPNMQFNICSCLVLAKLEGEKNHKKGGLNCVFGNFFFYVLDNCPQVQSLCAADKV